MAELPKDIHPTVKFGFFVGLNEQRKRAYLSTLQKGLSGGINNDRKNYF
jgi:hypothetical protein